jgi:hypothetical protein
MRDEADGGEDLVAVMLGCALGEGTVDLLDVRGVPGFGELGGGLRVAGKEDDAGGGAAKTVDGVCVGELGLHEAQQGVFEVASSGKSGETAGFIDGEEMGILQEDCEVSRGVGFDPGWAVPDEGLAGDEGFGAVGGEAVEGDLAVVQVLLPGFGG